MKRILYVIPLVFLSSAQVALVAQIRLHADSQIFFASREQGQAALEKDDLFARSMSRFDRQSRMQAEQPPTKEEYLKFASRHVVEWKKEQVEKITVAIQSAAEKMEPYRIPFPKRILLVTTDGQEEGGAAYCRGATVILPQGMLGRSARNLDRLLIHELFHVLSNQNPDLRRKLYAIIGFRPCGEVRLPEPLSQRKLTNPDGPTLDYFIEIQAGEKKIPVVPFLFSKTDYDPKKGGSFFQYMNFQLLTVEKTGADWKPVLREGQPVFHSPNGTPSYIEQIGENTGYIIHPDEVLADNFVFLVQRKQNLKTPGIVQQMKTILAR
ncbi:MAG: hypothetical protein VX768_11570 [Planctomycetota bacterium]|nr:hypothetical protein [Planctomycetota bacterium]